MTNAEQTENANPEDEGADQNAETETAIDPVQELEAELATSKDQTLRLAAELENVKKRAARAEADAKRYAVSRFAEDMLGVSDNLYRALDAIPMEARSEATELLGQLVEGVEMTQNSLQTALERHGVKQINPKGERFDPALHQAVAQIPSSEFPAGHIIEVVQRGYRIGERTLRAAIVAISSGTPNAAPTPTPEPEAEPGSTIDTKA